MVKEDRRKNIKVNESEFEVFSEKAEALGVTQTEMMRLLLQQDIERTETTKVLNRIEKDGED